ncbi:unnamed protein product [Adineta ricciae]|uniref:G-protein coupled receptors family 1 profile domain-containing protein n=1 Tax=Adineta ricciae TaxID=249248 RepID=A0A815CJP7_ADIRI|nr:unnamed protein product [Adineta ricciae]CAF1281234.1 unnamed protein product [Adineta ricciae]
MNDTSISEEPQWSRHLKFYIFTSIQLPSICVAVFILYRFYYSTKIHSRLHYHSLLTLLTIAFLELITELPLTLQFLYSGRVRPAFSWFCLVWIWYNCSLHSMNLFLMAWTSIERHILIFHSHLLQSSQQKFQRHYLPIIFSLFYIPLFYFICIFVYSCENTFNYTILLCGSICYNNLPWLAAFDWIVHICVPSSIIPVASIILLIRVIIQRKKMKRTLNWKTIRKLTLQLMFISSLYSIFWVSYALIIVIRLYFIPTFLPVIINYYFLYLPYFVQLFMPFLCLICLPELWRQKLRVVPLV